MALGGELRRVGHTQEHRARRLQPLDHKRVARRHEVLEQQRAVGDAPSCHPGRVLDREWHAQQRPVEAVAALCVDPIGLAARLRWIEIDDGVERRVARLDARDRHLGNVAGCRGTGADGGRDRVRGPVQQVGSAVSLAHDGTSRRFEPTLARPRW